jgi:hypothetical protein
MNGAVIRGRYVAGLLNPVVVSELRRGWRKGHGVDFIRCVEDKRRLNNKNAEEENKRTKENEVYAKVQRELWEKFENERVNGRGVMSTFA